MLKSLSDKGISVEDVPDISAEWYLDIASLGAASPAWVRLFGAFVTDAVIGVFAIVFGLMCWRARRGSATVLARALLAPALTALAYAVSEGVKELWREDRPCRVLGEVATIVDCPELGDWSWTRRPPCWTRPTTSVSRSGSPSPT